MKPRQIRPKMSAGLAPKGVKVTLMRQVPKIIPSKANMFRDIHARELRGLILQKVKREKTVTGKERVKRNTEILLKRLGLFDGRLHSNAELAKEYNISKDRASVIFKHRIRELLADSTIAPELLAHLGLKR